MRWLSAITGEVRPLVTQCGVMSVDDKVPTVTIKNVGFVPSGCVKRPPNCRVCDLSRVPMITTIHRLGRSLCDVSIHINRREKSLFGRCRLCIADKARRHLRVRTNSGPRQAELLKSSVALNSPLLLNFHAILTV
jgi:hypothetical protein